MTTTVIFFLCLHLLTSLILAAYGMHRLALVRRFIRRTAPARPAPPVTVRHPAVTVQIPLYNERYVAERAIRAAADLKYPNGSLDIQVLDDSTDDTTRVVARVVQTLAARGVDIAHVRRCQRSGFKAGALAHGLARARGDLIAIFDADFVPPSDFLQALVHEFTDPRVGMVQARWAHFNDDASLLTRIQAMQLDAHFTVEHGARAASGCFFNFNGTAGIWRKQAIETSGGWQAETLTEDLDLSYRAQLAGWRFVYRDDVATPAELPVEIAAYRQQQQRWAQGGVQTARKILPRILKSPLPGHVKREALWHLTSNVCYPILVLLAAAGLLAGLLAEPVHRVLLIGVDGTLLLFATISLSWFYGAAACARSGCGAGLRRLRIVPAVLVLGAGLSLSQSIAVVRGLSGRPTPFRRTPKYNHEDPNGRAWRRAAYRISAPGTAFLECAAGLVILSVGIASIALQAFVPPGPTVLFGLGFLATGTGSLLQHHRKVDQQ